VNMPKRIKGERETIAETPSVPLLLNNEIREALAHFSLMTLAPSVRASLE